MSRCQTCWQDHLLRWPVKEAIMSWIEANHASVNQLLHWPSCETAFEFTALPSWTDKKVCYIHVDSLQHFCRSEHLTSRPWALSTDPYLQDVRSCHCWLKLPSILSGWTYDGSGRALQKLKFMRGRCPGRSARGMGHPFNAQNMCWAPGTPCYLPLEGQALHTPRCRFRCPDFPPSKGKARPAAGARS